MSSTLMCEHKGGREKRKEPEKQLTKLKELTSLSNKSPKCKLKEET